MAKSTISQSESQVPLIRLLYLDEKELADVQMKRMVGTESDCWHLVDLAGAPEAVKIVIRDLCQQPLPTFKKFRVGDVAYHVNIGIL